MIIPSIGEEGFGIVALEGMACGCKIIAADAGGLSEAVRNFGKLFRMGNQQELENLLKIEITELKKYSNNIEETTLKNYLSEHNKKAVAEKYLTLFN
ncbi:MAG TPA: glycosyltransferase, partial [Segetibacter sp.]